MASSTTPPSSSSTKPTLVEAQKVIYDAGLETRYAVAGKKYVDAALQNGSSEYAPLSLSLSSPLHSSSPPLTEPLPLTTPPSPPAVLPAQCKNS